MKTHQRWRESIQERLFMFMNITEQNSNSEPFSAKKTIKPVNFRCTAPEAKTVEIAGDFNCWHPSPMQRQADGSWFVQMQMCHGHHLYKFIVDGESMPDPRSMGLTRNEYDERVSVIAVS